MHYSEIMVRWWALNQGKNRMRFINKLKRNIQSVLSIYPRVHVKADRDRTHIYLHGTDYQPVAESLKQILDSEFLHLIGLKSLHQPWLKLFKTIMKQVYQEGMTFKITSKRSDHSFELDSREQPDTWWCRFEAIPNVQVKMKAPDIERGSKSEKKHYLYLLWDAIRGAGDCQSVLQERHAHAVGWIDSPVAGYLALKRGVDIEAVHLPVRLTPVHRSSEK